MSWRTSAWRKGLFGWSCWRPASSEGTFPRIRSHSPNMVASNNWSLLYITGFDFDLHIVWDSRPWSGWSCIMLIFYLPVHDHAGNDFFTWMSKVCCICSTSHLCRDPGIVWYMHSQLFLIIMRISIFLSVEKFKYIYSEVSTISIVRWRTHHDITGCPGSMSLLCQWLNVVFKTC